MIARVLLFNLVGLVSVLALAGCTAKSSPSSNDTTITQTVTNTRTTSGGGKAIALTNVATLPPGQNPPKGEVEKACPYIASTPDENPNVNVADFEGDHVYRTTVLTGMNPVGCRFYFYAPPYEPVADITTYRFSSAVVANNSLVLTARHDTEAFNKSIATGVTGVLFRAKLNPEDGGQDWSCGFVKGDVVVIVRTRQNVSFNAGEIAGAIAAKF